MTEDEPGAGKSPQRCNMPKRDLSNSALLTVSDEVKAHIATLLERLGHDPSAAYAGWRSTDAFVVALLYAAHGYPVFPCSLFKQPLTKHGFHDATTNIRTLIGWEQSNRNRDYDRFEPVPVWAVRTGRYDDPDGPPGLWIWDVDDAAGYARWAELQNELGSAAPTWRCMSARPGGGEHWIVVRIADERKAIGDMDDVTLKKSLQKSRIIKEIVPNSADPARHLPESDSDFRQSNPNLRI